MTHRTVKPCWKCGRGVSHERYRLGKPEPGMGFRERLRAWWRAGRYESPGAKVQTVPRKHYVEKNKGFIVCPGSGRSA
jgi:hypothetical protein